MKLEQNKKYLTVSLYAFLVIVASILFFLFLFNISYFTSLLSKIVGILSPFIYAFSIAYLLNPLMKWLERRVVHPICKEKLKPKFQRMISILLTFAVFLAVLAILFFTIIPEVANSISNLTHNISSYATKLEDFAKSTLVYFLGDEQTAAHLVQNIGGMIGSAEEVLYKVYTMVTNALPHVVGYTIQITSGIVRVLVGFIISIYVLYNKERFLAQSKKVLYALMKKERVDSLIRLGHKSNAIFSGFIGGKILDSLIIGVLCFIFMSIFSFPYPMLISVLVGVTNVIPYFGPFIGAIPSILLVLMINPVQALWFALFILALQQFDGNILGPKILGQSIGISAFWVIFSIILAGGLFGFLGMFIGVPVFAIIYTLIRGFIEERLAKKNMPTDTHDYTSDDNPIRF
ncbi:AI-2E family transporter [Zongyangia hominis]|uniref:AI-2E family transporter n=1 Tax=Zongyangia hominis TaxID=2763677 RepID=A0A926EE00_9FIRM|nr:AI-2E family transporter [Zongyangia hominis]MBC8569997.1 AI-2E family transporter [Zongyangia hominis]